VRIAILDSARVASPETDEIVHGLFPFHCVTFTFTFDIVQHSTTGASKTGSIKRYGI
jgi:hypothetical protein